MGKAVSHPALLHLNRKGLPTLVLKHTNTTAAQSVPAEVGRNVRDGGTAAKRAVLDLDLVRENRKERRCFREERHCL